MTTKKFTAIILAVLMMLCCFAACSDDGAKDNKGNKSEVSDLTSEESSEESSTESSEESNEESSEESDGRHYVIDLTDLTPYVTLGDYEGVSFVFTDVNEEYIDEVRKSALEEAKYAVDANRPAALGDLLVIDYTGYYKDSGEAFDNGSAENATLDPLGEAGYIEGFESALVGHSVGESFDIFVTFPDEYHVEALKGEEARFAITVKAVQEYVYPEITDELAEKYGYESADALNEAIENVAKEKAATANLGAAWDAAVKNSSINKYPEALYQQRVNDFVEYWMDYYRNASAQYGVELEELLGQTEEELEAELTEMGKEDADGYLKEELIMFAIAKDIGADEISDEEFDKFVEEYAERKGVTVEELKEDFNDTELRTNIMWDKVKEYVLEKAVPTGAKTYVTMKVENYGTIELELDSTYAPITVANFVKLVEEGFYDGLTFHRIMEGFMIQGGDPDHNGTGGSDETIKGEFSANGVENPLKHTRGVISMARANDPDSASSQFFIMHEDAPHLDGNYAAFGKVISGMEVVDAIAEAAEPTDNNGTIPYEKQPVISSVTIGLED